MGYIEEMGDPLKELYPLSRVMELVEERLKRGAQKYGETTYISRDVLGEMEEEVLDIIAYAYLFYLKVQAFRGLAAAGGVE